MVTVRSNDPVVDPAIGRLVDDLWTLPGVDRLTLAPLDPDDVAALVHDLTGGAAADGLVDRIVDLGQGSPLLTEQLVAAGVDETNEVPETVLQPTLARLQRMDPETRRVLQAASLADGHLSHRLLRQACQSVDGDGFETALGQALDARLLRFDPRDRSYSFAHALLRQAVETSMRPEERIRGHRRWAEVLSLPENHGNDPQLQIAAAHHWAEADSDVEAFDAALRAVEITGRFHAMPEQAPLLRRVLSLWDRVPDPQARAGQTREALLMEVVFLLGRLGRYGELRGLIDAELQRPDVADRSLDALTLRVYLALIGTWEGTTDDQGAFDEVVDRIPELIEAEPTASTIQLLWIGAERLAHTDPARAVLLLERALETARRLGSENLHLAAIDSLNFQLVTLGRFQEALAMCQAEEDATDSPRLKRRIRAFRAIGLYCAGDFKGSLALGERELSRGDPQLDPEGWAETAWIIVVSVIALGRWDRAAAVLNQIGQYGLERTDLLLDHALESGLLACYRADLSGADAIAAQARSLLPGHGGLPDVHDPWQRLVEDGLHLWQFVCVMHLEAEVMAARGDAEKPRAHLAPLLELAVADTLVEMWLPVLCAARIEGDHPRSSTADGYPYSLEALESLIERMPRDGAFLSARYLQAKADLARARGHDELSTWQRVADAWRGIGHRHHLGWALLRVASTLILSGERDRAAEPLTEAGRIAVDLGAMPLKDGVIDLATRSRIPTDLQRASPDVRSGRLARLTPREIEVLQHLTRGLSNDELAALLFISPRTASVHVSRILAKLQVDSRAKAAAVAYQEGLVAPDP